MSKTLDPALPCDPHAAATSLVEAVPGALRAHALLCLEALCKFAGRPLPSVRHAARIAPRGDGEHFGMHKGSFAGVIVPMIVLSMLVELPLCNLLIHAFALPDTMLLHVATMAIYVWTLLWAVGLRSAMRHVDHVLGDEALVLAVGFGSVCRVPLAAVKDAHVIKGDAHKWQTTRGLRRRDVAWMAVLDAPTLLIELRADHANASLVRGGRARAVPSWIAVCADEPISMRAALLARRGDRAAVARAEAGQA